MVDSLIHGHHPGREEAVDAKQLPLLQGEWEFGKTTFNDIICQTDNWQTSKVNESPFVLRASPNCCIPDNRPGGWHWPRCKPGLWLPSREADVAIVLFRKKPLCLANMSTDTGSLCRKFNREIIYIFEGSIECINVLKGAAAPRQPTGITLTKFLSHFRSPATL